MENGLENKLEIKSIYRVELDSSQLYSCQVLKAQLGSRLNRLGLSSIKRRLVQLHASPKYEPRSSFLEPDSTKPSLGENFNFSHRPSKLLLS